MSIKRIRQLIQNNQYRLTRHAVDECRSRQIRINDIEDAVGSGEVIETHVDDWGFDCFLIAGERFNGDIIHIACKIVDNMVQINTVYFPHTHLWEKDRKRKKGH